VPTTRRFKTQSSFGKIVELKVLPLADKLTLLEVKTNFINCYDEDQNTLPVQLASSLAQVGSGADVSELKEAEKALTLSTTRWWNLLASECTADFIDSLQAQLAGDHDPTFRPSLATVTELLATYDAVTLELEPNRANSVAISELRERLKVAASGIDLASRIVLCPIEELEMWAEIWIQHLKVSNTRPNSEFKIDDEHVQALLTALREVNVGKLIEMYVQRKFEVDRGDPSSDLINKGQKLRGQLPDSVHPILDRTSCLKRMKRTIQDSNSGKVLGPCEVTALKAESSILKGYDDSTKVVKDALKDLHTVWETAYKAWLATADFSDFPSLHAEFEAV
jgi:hypothetical protein